MTNVNSTSFSLPQHPLPEEIQQMRRDETVCKFCGVSYLIHNEVKALQEKLAEAERQMEYYKGSVEREKVLKEKLQKMDGEFLEQSQKLTEQDQQLELFKSDLKMKAKLINDMYLQKRQHECTIAEEKSKTENLSACILQITSMVRQERECLNILKKDFIEHRMSSKKILMYFGGNIKKVTKRLKDKVEQERNDLKMNWEKMNEQLFNCETELNILRQADLKLVDLKTKYVDLENKLDIYQKHVTQLEEGNEMLREKNTAIENQLIQKSNNERDINKNFETMKKEKQEEHVKHKELLMKKEEELKKLNVLCKSLEKLMNEKSLVEKEVREKVTDKDIQIKNLEETVNKMRIASGKIDMEREQTIVSHHNRIEQLRESYIKKLEAAEKTCTVLRNELDELKQKVEANEEGSLRSLRGEYEEEIRVLNGKHSQEVDILNAEIKNLKDKLDKEKNAFLNVRQEINELKNTLSINKTKSAQESQQYQNEILDLRKNLEALQHEQHKTDDEDEVKVLKSRYEAIQKTLKDIRAQMKIMEQTLTAKNSEMIVLQDTVRRECEERLELTQALSDTRMQLLSLQQNSDAPRQFPSTKRLTNRPSVNTTNLKTAVNPVETSSSHDVTSSETSEIIASRVRRIKSTGSENPKATRESVDSFRERIAAALGRDGRVNHTR